MNASFRAAFWCLTFALGLPLILIGGAQFLPIDQSRLLALHERNPHWGLHRRVPQSTAPGGTPTLSIPQPGHNEVEPVMVAEGRVSSQSTPEERSPDATPVTELPYTATSHSRRPSVTLTATQKRAPQKNQVTLEAPEEAESSTPPTTQQEQFAEATNRKSDVASRKPDQRRVEFRVEPTPGNETQPIAPSRLEARLVSLQQHLERMTQMQLDQSQQQRQIDQVQQATLRAQQLQDQANVLNLQRQVQALQIALENSRPAPGSKALETAPTPVSPSRTATTSAPAGEQPEIIERAGPVPADQGHRNSLLKGNATSSGLFTLECREADGGDTLALLGKLAGRNVVVSRQLTERVSAHLRNATFDQALASITRALGAVTERDGEFLYVLSPAEVETRKDSLRRPTARLYRPHHISVQELQPLLEPLLTPQIGRLAITSGTNSEFGEEAAGQTLAQHDALLVFDLPEVQREVEKVLLEMDTPPPQLEIEATILSVQLNEGLRQGVNLAAINGFTPDAAGGQTANCGPEGCLTPTASFQGESGLKCGRLQCGCRQFVQNLEQIAETQLVANPRVLVVNRQPACLAIGGRFGFRASNCKKSDVQFIDAGTRIKIRPFIATDGLIRLEIHPECSSAVLDLQTGLPKVKTAEMATQVLIPDGQTVVIGGLMEERLAPPAPRLRTSGHWPWSKEKCTSLITTRNELIVLITTRIVHGSSAPLLSPPTSVTPGPTSEFAMPPTAPPVPTFPGVTSRVGKAPARLANLQTRESLTSPRPSQKATRLSAIRNSIHTRNTKVAAPQIDTGEAAEPPESETESDAPRKPVASDSGREDPGSTNLRSQEVPTSQKPAVAAEPQSEDHRVERALGEPEVKHSTPLRSEPVTILPAPPAFQEPSRKISPVTPASLLTGPSRIIQATNKRTVPAETGKLLEPEAKPTTQTHRTTRNVLRTDSPYSNQPLNLSPEENAVLAVEDFPLIP